MEENKQTETTQIEETGVKEQKTFTSEEVSAIVQKRLASYRKSAAKDIEAEYQEKYNALEKREKAFMIKSALSERGMPQELATIISFTDETDLNSKLDQLQTIYSKQEQKKEPQCGFASIGAAPGEEVKKDSLENIFKYKGRI